MATENVTEPVGSASDRAFMEMAMEQVRVQSGA